MAALRVINGGKSVISGKETFFILSFLVLRWKDICWISLWHRNRSNTLLPAQSSHLPMASGYKNHVQHVCSEKDSQGTKTSEQQTANLVTEGFNSPAVLHILFKKRTSVSLSERAVSVPVNSPGFCHRWKLISVSNRIVAAASSSTTRLWKSIHWEGNPPLRRIFDDRNSWCASTPMMLL